MSVIMMVIFAVFVLTNLPRTVLGLYEVTTISSILECYDRACQYRVSSLRSVTSVKMYQLIHDFNWPLPFLSDGWWTVGCATYSCWIPPLTSPSTALSGETSGKPCSASFIENIKLRDLNVVIISCFDAAITAVIFVTWMLVLIAHEIQINRSVVYNFLSNLGSGSGSRSGEGQKGRSQVRSSSKNSKHKDLEDLSYSINLFFTHHPDTWASFN